MSRKLTLVTMYLLACSACMRERQQEVDSIQKSVPSRTDKPHFELKPSQQQSLREHVMTLNLGEMRPSVTALMGSADLEEFLGPKKGLEWKCRGLVYYVVIFDQRPGNENDRRVEFIFNREDALVTILSNVDGIASRGDMSVCR
jgi:hypothetical protein